VADDKGNKGEGTGGDAGSRPAAMEMIDEKTMKIVSAEQVAQAEAIEKAGKETLQTMRDITAANIQNNIVQGEMLLSMGQVKQAADAYEQAQKRHLELMNMKNLSISVGNKLEEQMAAAKAANDEEEIKRIELKKALLIENREAVEESLASLEERLNLLKEETEEYRNLNDAGKRAYNDMKPGVQAVATGIFQIVQAQDTMIGKGMIRLAQLKDQAGAAAGLKLAFKEVFNLTNIMASMTQVVLDSFLTMFLALDKAQAKFAAATGTGRQYMESIESVRKSNMHLGVSLNDTTAAFEGLLTQLIGFTDLTTEQQEELAGQIAQFERLGIKAEQSADLMNTFSKIMGTTAKESANLTQQLALMGTSIGISSQRMIKDFQKAQTVLAVYGKGSLGIFRKLAAAARAAGVEMNDLLGLASQFDTFESSADSVAKLNAILGSNMSATRMVMMTEEERVETIIREIQVSGESFKQMSRHKQLAVAAAAGINDMAKANKLFGMSMSQYRAYTNEMANAKHEQEQLDKATQATQDIAQQFQNLMLEFAPQVTDFLETFKSGLEFLQGAFAGINKFLAPLGMSMGGIIFALGTFGLAIKLLSAPVALVSSAMGGLSGANQAVGRTGPSAAKGFRVMAVGLKALGKAGATAVTTILSIGAAVLMMGGGIAAAALGVAELVKSFAGLGDAAGSAALGIGLLMVPFVAFFGLMAFVVYSGVGPLTAAVMLAMGAAALMLGVGIGLAAFGLSYFVDSLVKLAPHAASTALAFAGMAVSMAVMSLGAALLAVSLLVMVPALLGVGLTALVASLGIGLLGGAMMIAGVGAMIFGVGLGMAAESLLTIASGGAGAGLAMAAVGLGLLGMAAGLAAMFVFISNPLGWLVIGAAMMAMSRGVRAFTKGLGDLDPDKLTALEGVSKELKSLSGVSADATIVATVTQELEDFEKSMDSTMMAQVASLGAFNDIRAINTTRAETQAQYEIKMPENLTLNAEHTIHTNIGNQPFQDIVHKTVNKIPWSKYDEAPKRIVVAGQPD